MALIQGEHLGLFTRHLIFIHLNTVITSSEVSKESNTVLLIQKARPEAAAAPHLDLLIEDVEELVDGEGAVGVMSGDEVGDAATRDAQGATHCGEINIYY